MGVGTRFSLIERIFQTVSDSPQSWDLIDVMLDEFGADYIAGNPASTCLARIKSLDTEHLLDLDQYLHPDPEGRNDAESPPLTAGPWREGAYRIFVSHTVRHKQIAEQLRQWNERVMIDCFVAHSSIPATRRWRDEIEVALRTCHAFVALVTPDFIESQWCDQEAGMAFALRKLIVPIRMGADPHGFIGERQGLTVSQSTTNYSLAEALFGLLAQHPDARDHMIDPVLLRFTRSWSWDNTRTVWPYVAGLPRSAWTDERVASVRQAGVANVDVRDGIIVRPGKENILAPDAFEEHLSALGIGKTDADIPFSSNGAAAKCASHAPGPAPRRPEQVRGLDLAPPHKPETTSSPAAHPKTRLLEPWLEP